MFSSISNRASTWLSAGLFMLMLIGLGTATDALTQPIGGEPAAEVIRERIIEVRPDMWTVEVERMVEAIMAASERHTIGPLLITAVIEIESAYHADAQGSAGERGLMQIKETTAPEVGLWWEAAYDVERNINSGAYYLSKHLHNYGLDARRALMRYNGGSRKKQYAEKVLTVYAELKARYNARLTD